MIQQDLTHIITLMRQCYIVTGKPYDSIYNTRVATFVYDHHGDLIVKISTIEKKVSEQMLEVLVKFALKKD